MQHHYNIDIPKKLPFLEAICCDLDDVHVLNLDEMLNRYERGWENRGALADLDEPEKCFVSQLAKATGSWLQVDV